MRKLVLSILTVCATFYGFAVYELLQTEYPGNADYIELQGKIDSAIVTGKAVYVNRNYKIDKPLVAAKWNGTDYKFFTIRIIGDALMWDVGQTSVIEATFTDAPILSIHKSKGSIIRGVNFKGAGVNGRDSRWSPATCLAIDPFRYNLPPDSGYPSLRTYYRGSTSKGGSTGIRIEDCWFGNTVVGAIVSPSGWVQNAEMITFENIQLGNLKVGISGCQAQEKMNRIINVGAMSTIGTVFGFNMYGEGRPGQWFIDGVNVAGDIGQLVYRGSDQFYPLMINNVFAESLGKIGYWQSQLSDALTNAQIDFKHPDKTHPLPDAHLSGGGVRIENSTIRYYGYKSPIIFKGKVTGQGNAINDSLMMAPYKLNERAKLLAWQFNVIIDSGRIKSPILLPVGATILFSDYRNRDYVGQGKVTDSVTISYISPAIKNGIYTIQQYQ